MNRSQSPSFQIPEPVSYIQPEEIRLDNGISVFSFFSDKQDVVKLEWVFRHVDDKMHKLTALAVSGLLLDGTTGKTAGEVADLVDFHGAFLNAEYGFDATTLSLHCLGKHLTALLPLVREILEEAAFPDKEVLRYAKNSKQQLSVSLEKNRFRARRRFNKALFGSSAYGLVPEVEDYDSLTPDAIGDHYRHQFVPDNCTIFASGNVNPAVLKALDAHFGSWKAVGQPASRLLIQLSPQTGLLYEERKQSLQSAVRIGFQTPHQSHVDFPGLQILSTVLGGYFGSRLMKTIREEKGYTYGIGAAIGSMQQAAFFTIATDVGKEFTEATLVEINHQINLLREKTIPDEELILVRNYLKGSLLGSVENIFSHADAYKSLYINGAGTDYFQRYQEAIDQCSADELRNLATRYFDQQNFIEVVVGLK